MGRKESNQTKSKALSDEQVHPVQTTAWEQETKTLGIMGGQDWYGKGRAVEICPTCPTWSHFIQDKLKISVYLSFDKYKCINKLMQFCISYFD